MMQRVSHAQQRSQSARWFTVWSSKLSTVHLNRTEVLGQIPPDEPAEVRDQHLLQGPASLGGGGKDVGVGRAARVVYMRDKEP